MTTEPTLEIDSLQLGDAWAGPYERDKHSLLVRRSEAEAKLFPFEITPTTSDAVAAYAAHIERQSVSRFAEGLAGVHARSLTAWPTLAALCRSPEALDDVAAAAANRAAAALNMDSGAAAKAGEEARSRYQRMIAEQVAATPDHELAITATEFLGVDALLARLESAKARHEEHARGELARAEAERRAAVRVIADRAAEKVRAAEAAAADLRARATLAENEYRKLRSDAFVARLRATGLTALRVGTGDGEQLYSVADLVANASTNAFTLETLARFEAALARFEAAA